jgi:hypothetical protein
VSIYTTFTGVDIIRLNKKFQPLPEQGETPRFDTTVVLVPDVEVLRVIREVEENALGQQQDASASSSIQVILALQPEDAQKFVYALEQGIVYLSLLPPGEEGVQLDPLTAAQIFLPKAPANGNAEA